MRIRFLVPVLAPVLITGAFAQSPRISSLKGSVTIRRGDSGPSSALARDTTLATDDRILTAANGRAEFQLDPANVLQLSGNTEILVVRLEDQHFRISLAQGVVTWQVVAPSTAQASVDTPNITVAPVREGSYRVTVKAGESEIVPLAGDIEAFAPAGSQWITEGQRMLVRGPAGNPEFRILNRMRFWRRLAGLFRNMQIGTDIGFSGSSSDESSKKKTDDRKSATSKSNQRTPHHEKEYKGGSQHRDASPPPPSDSGNSHSSSPARSSGGSHSAPPAHSGGGSHSAPGAPASHSDSGSHAAASSARSDSGSHAAASSSHSDGGSHSSSSSSSSGHK